MTTDRDDAMARHPAGGERVDRLDPDRDFYVYCRDSCPACVAHAKAEAIARQNDVEFSDYIRDLGSRVEPYTPEQIIAFAVPDEPQPMADARHWRALVEARATIARVEALAEWWQTGSENWDGPTWVKGDLTANAYASELRAAIEQL